MLGEQNPYLRGIREKSCLGEGRVCWAARWTPLGRYSWSFYIKVSQAASLMFRVGWRDPARSCADCALSLYEVTNG